MEENCVVGVDEFAVYELVSWGISQRRRIAVSEHFDDLVVFIEQSDHATKIGDEHRVVTEEVVARTAHSICGKLHKHGASATEIRAAHCHKGEYLIGEIFSDVYITNAFKIHKRVLVAARAKRAEKKATRCTPSD